MTLTAPTPTFIHHAAALDHLRGIDNLNNSPLNSLEAIRACLEAGADWIEIDVMPLADTDYLLVHDPNLEVETSGYGPVKLMTAAQAMKLTIKNAPTHQVPQLRDVVELFIQYGGKSRLQIDFKTLQPFANDEPLQRLIDIIKPLGDRVLVSSRADWQLRKLCCLADWLQIGFDVSFYLDWHVGDARPGVHPKRRGMYGYWDDHYIMTEQVRTPADYLRTRCNTFIRLVRNATTFYINYQLLTRSLDDGFNWAEVLHKAGIQLAAWTVDTNDASAIGAAQRLLATGVDQFTTNTPNELRAILTASVVTG